MHHRDHRRPDRFAGSQHIHRRVRGRARRCSLARRQDQRPTTVRDQTAFQTVERVGDDRRFENLGNADRASTTRTRVAVSPETLRSGDARKLLVRDAVVMHEPEHWKPEHIRRAGDTIRPLILVCQWHRRSWRATYLRSAHSP